MQKEENMKISVPCVDVINEILEDIVLYGLDEPCYLINEIDKPYYRDYLLKSEFETSDISKSEEIEETTLIKALFEFVELNSALPRPPIAYKLLAIRSLAGLSQAKLAEQLGVDPKNYSKWETGERNPKLDSLIKIAQICKIDIKYFL